MSSPFESAQLNLQLYDLQREPVLRQARDRFLRDFDPDTFAELKVRPFLSEMRAASGEPDFCKHVEAVVLGAADAEAILARRLAALRAATQARRGQAPGS